MTADTEMGKPQDLSDEPPRRDFLYLAAGATAAVGAAIATWPLIDSWNPGADTAALSSIEVDLSPIQIGQRVTVKWRGQPIFIDHRPQEEIARARAVDISTLRDPQKDSARVKKAEWLIVIGVCTHLGCIPQGQSPRSNRGEFGGWYCSCHGSQYDTSGRIRKGPAPKNLYLPPYRFLTDHTIKIG